MNDRKKLIEAVERVMIAERRDEQRRRLDEAGHIKEDAKRLSELFAGLELGAFSADVLRDVYATGGRETKQRYTEAVNAEMEAIKSPILRKAMAENVGNLSTPFFNEAERIKKQRSPNALELIQYLEITSEGAQLTEDGKARLIDSARHYITDPEEIAKHREYLELMERLNAFFKHGKAIPATGWWNVFRLNEDGCFIYPYEGVNYPFFINRGRETERDAVELTPEPKPEVTPEPKDEPKQQNRVRGGIVKGITKPPTQHDRGAELRNRNPLARELGGCMTVEKP